MNDKMTVVYIKKTGHVVAALTRATDPGEKFPVASVAGTGLLVRNRKKAPSAAAGNGEQLLLPLDSLDTASVEYNVEVFGSPLSFAVGGGVAARQGGIFPTITGFTVSGITVALASGTAKEDLDVWVQVEEAEPVQDTPERRFVAGTIKAGDSSKSLSFTIPPGQTIVSLPNPTGDYFVLVLLAGHMPSFDKRTPAP